MQSYILRSIKTLMMKLGYLVNLKPWEEYCWFFLISRIITNRKPYLCIYQNLKYIFPLLTPFKIRAYHCYTQFFTFHKGEKFVTTQEKIDGNFILMLLRYPFFYILYPEYKICFFKVILWLLELSIYYKCKFPGKGLSKYSRFARSLLNLPLCSPEWVRAKLYLMILHMKFCVWGISKHKCRIRGHA